MLELLIISMCANSITYTSCNESTRAYVAQPHVKPKLRHARQTAAEVLGPTTMQVVPTIAAMVQGKYSARLHKNIYLTVRDQETLLIYKLSF